MTRDIFKIVFMLMMIIGFGGAQVSGIGVGLYDWAHGIPFSTAAWNGFVIWLELMTIGFLGFILALITGGV